MVSSSASSGPLALVLLLSISSSIAHGAGAGAGGDEERRQRFTVVQTSHLQPQSICSGLKVIPSGNRTWVPLHRPYSPCSPSSSPSPPPSLLEILQWDQFRTASVRRRAMSDDDDVVEYPDTPHVEVQQIDFGLQAPFGYGSVAAAGGSRRLMADGDPTSQTMAIDTTIDVPWIQCRPCPIPQCYPQRDALFDPTRSSTAAPVPCGSRACRALGNYGNGCSRRSLRRSSNNSSRSDCNYRVAYSDGRATSGTYMTDTLTISPGITFPNFRFGCSHSVRGRFSGQTSGTMSLGGGRQSLRSQTASAYGDAFSYCVPQPSASGFLSLGGAIGSSGSGSGFASTPLVATANPTFYVVRLQGIDVAGRRLNVPPAVFSAGTLMDSSAVVTQLPPTAYRALRRAFRNAMRRYRRVPAGGKQILDTCYDFEGLGNVTVPAVSLVFSGGAVVRLEPMAVMMEGCLAFVPTPADSDLGFIGNVQQQTHEVLYDVGARNVGFRRGAC
ncbi:aspartyl protease family protein At5g10770 [Brachypodium distachyon]|uniref:Peptidase A1 domain-containing protein n=1 Tax=Brachypodium distachyon TaxID=15368 RepID=A0A0Q3JPE5_BRADI|nr:aspartyl protease family protein At5g10770 [Brachypodium distachyon]KQK19611.2 hypothetical protein BRADI_1g49380v3 [Brachypodium distachyon]|eukprot:XP_014757829.1 aspartyl protease family protein At5g10770 [Brachypodium distachyon]